MYGPQALLALNFLCDVNFWDLAKSSDPVTLGVMGTLGFASLLSWTIILAKMFSFRRARSSNRKFLRAFRKAPRLDAVAAASEQYRAAPLVGVFDFGYSEVCRQLSGHKRMANQTALERTLQLGISEEVTRLERNMNWLATCAAVCPFIGLFGTVLGIIDAFNQLGLSGSTSMRAVGPGIARALLATAMGLAAAIPAAVFYNYFGNAVKEIAARLEDFSLEFLNLAERNFES
ncbi:MAG TPA: MotA/TolQ/ExbB proton channel family protein [Bryobacteraceae bacterium]|nr:MotA/TolQ/ExbB proton channel family protein [Bryobacteraceae bacterium]